MTHKCEAIEVLQQTRQPERVSCPGAAINQTDRLLDIKIAVRLSLHLLAKVTFRHPRGNHIYRLRQVLLRHNAAGAFYLGGKTGFGKPAHCRATLLPHCPLPVLRGGWPGIELRIVQSLTGT